MALRLHNTLTSSKEEFEPQSRGKVKMYSCGQTIYDDLHIGNAMAYAYWDTLRRYLEYKGYTVRHVQNITDVGHLTDDGDQGDDKVESRARELGLEPMELVETQIQRYFEDTNYLNIDRQDIVPRATGHINEMIHYIKEILDNGYAYESGGNVYLDLEKVASDKGYGELVGKKLSELKQDAENRVEEDSSKKDQADFALWINADEGHAMTWESPWSEGYPGWHLECSVMSQEYLGEKFDIHAGGKDHVFPHHPNERAQAKAHSGGGMAEFWMHNEFITVDGEKMSKSKGNFRTVRELRNKGFSGNAIRLNLISSHYRSESVFSTEDLEKSEKEIRTVKHDLKAIKQGSGKKTVKPSPKKIESEFKSYMDDDLGTAKAKQHLLESLKAIKQKSPSHKSLSPEYARTYERLFKILGVRLGETEIRNQENLVAAVMKARKQMRENGEYSEADNLRKALEESGVTVEDEGDDSFWSA